MKKTINSPAAIGAAIAFAIAGWPATASAQQLSDGDYELCSVYDYDGQFVGYDSVCLEHKRAALRRLERRSPRYPRDTGVYRCPHWANGGRGYNATWYSDGRPPSLTGFYTYDATLDGRPCIPHPTYNGSGYR